MKRILTASLALCWAVLMGLMPVLGEASHRPGRSELLAEMAKRPADPWPRGTGHIVFSMPGLPEDWKAYHEPGGSFSPGFGTFGISLWVVDDQDRLVTTSDSIPLNKVEQRWTWSGSRGWPARPDLPVLETRTPYYRCSWTVLGEGRYQMHLRPNSGTSVWIMVRRPGPAGGPIHALQEAGSKLFVNDRWTLEFKGPGLRLDFADPRHSASDDVFWPAERAWGYARARVMPSQDTWLNIDSVQRPPTTSLPSLPGRGLVELELPDQRFGECLDAQLAHLAMGLSGNETRPGEPNNYPLNWLRDGAYTLVALARAGHLEVAKELCRPFAEQDFFGGFGSEADAPGLALWALEEVAAVAQDTTFEDWLWPHVARKASLIEAMLSASAPLRKSFAGPVVPAHANEPDLNLVCDAARDGLIIGRMDWHRPILFVNAVSYRGLVAAARLARARGFDTQAERWDEQAAALRITWNEKLRGHESDDPRTAICGFHPAWVVTDREAYAAVLDRQRSLTHRTNGQRATPLLWTYFAVAKAHQELFLGRESRAWADLLWFWEHQASPGLYSWWEGNGEENSFDRWNRVMGWVNPPYVTPHYWTAAEMALLQLDMLAAVDESRSKPTMVIGLGVRPQWLSHRLRAKGLRTRFGEVSWEWQRGRLTVRHRGPEVDIVPGPVFPSDAELRIR